MIVTMDSNMSELSSMASTLDGLTRRIGSLADEALSRKSEDVASELLAVERALSGAHRRLERLLSGRR
ncbi:MAG TPA: hypothetical protein VGS21_03065 [Acidimicrobiales bacterium]|nr:hypothetical protein [Acidimicrobiales bacterium]